MNPSIAKYKKTLKKHLRCTGDVKKRLLAKFDDALRLYLEENPSPDELALQSAFGMPEDMAKILMAEVTPLEAIDYRKSRIALKIIAGIMLTVFLVLTIYIYFIKQSEIIVYEEIIPGTTVHTDTAP